MDISTIILYIMVVFMVIGGVDKILGNKLGYGEKFEEGKWVKKLTFIEQPKSRLNNMVIWIFTMQ